MSKFICCIECKFFAPGEFGRPKYEITAEMIGKLTIEDAGQCRINPPVFGEEEKIDHVEHAQIYAIFPRVLGDDWCGKFEQQTYKESEQNV